MTGFGRATSQACARLCVFLGVLGAASASAWGQDATIVYRIGRDTVAIEQFRRTASRMVGESVCRHGDFVARTQYDVTLERGRLRAMVVRARQPDGAPIAGLPLEWRLSFGRDSVLRETVWRDSTRTQAFAAANAFFLLPILYSVPAPQGRAQEAFVYPHALFELLAAAAAGRDSLVAAPLAGSAVRMIHIQRDTGGVVHLRGVPPSAELMRFDRDGHLLWTDGASVTSTRVAGKVDIAAFASQMTPTGVLSPRATAYAEFDRGPIFINYGRPSTRGRSVWGGILVPFDSIWRTGANEATHLATSKTIVIGDLTLAPGLYTLWTRYTHSGAFLIVNRQVGQWGTAYDSAQDIGRVRMDMAPAPEHVETFTITVRATGPHRGAFDFAWGDSVATAPFTVRP